MSDVDIHILRSPGRDQWFDKAFNSVRDESNVYVLDGIPNNLGLGRIIGYSLGSAPYVGFVDDDDWWVRGAITTLAEELDKLPKEYVSAYGDDILVDTDGNFLKYSYGYKTGEWNPVAHILRPYTYIHNCILYRRDVIEKVLDRTEEFNPHCDVYIRSAVCQHGIHKHVDIQGYNWRVHAGGQHTKKLKSDTNHRTQVTLYSTKVLMKHIKENNV